VSNGLLEKYRRLFDWIIQSRQSNINKQHYMKETAETIRIPYYTGSFIFDRTVAVNQHAVQGKPWKIVHYDGN